MNFLKNTFPIAYLLRSSYFSVSVLPLLKIQQTYSVSCVTYNSCMRAYAHDNIFIELLTYRPCCGPTFPLSNEELAVISSSLMVPSCIPNGAMHCAKQQEGSVITFGPCLPRVSYLHGSTPQLSPKSNINRRGNVRERFFIMRYISGHFICKKKESKVSSVIIFSTMYGIDNCMNSYIKV